MKTGTLILAARYAKALDRIAKNTDEAARNLASFEEALKNIQNIPAYLVNPTINSQVKESLIEKSLPDNLARAFLKVLIKEKRFYLANEILKELNVLLDERRGIKRAQVTSAVHSLNSNIIMSAAVMPETTNNIYYYGQDIPALSKY